MSTNLQGLRRPRSIDAGVAFTWDAPTLLLAFDELEAEIDRLTVEMASRTKSSPSLLSHPRTSSTGTNHARRYS